MASFFLLSLFVGFWVSFSSLERVARQGRHSIIVNLIRICHMRLPGDLNPRQGCRGPSVIPRVQVLVVGQDWTSTCKNYVYAARCSHIADGSIGSHEKRNARTFRAEVLELLQLYFKGRSVLENAQMFRYPRAMKNGWSRLRTV